MTGFKLDMSVDTENESLSWGNMYLVKKHKINQNEGVEVLKLWLMTESKLSEEELKQVWKSLLFKTNKHLTSCELFEKLSVITEALDTNLTRQYFQVFLMAMKKEWGFIDYFNLDNFNHVLGGILCHMQFVLNKNCWDRDLVNKFMGAIVQRTLLAIGKPQGMDLHFANRYLSALHWFLPMPLYSHGHLIEIKLQIKRANAFTCLLKNGGNLLKVNQKGKDFDMKENLRLIGITGSFLQLVALPSSLQDNAPFLDKVGREFMKLYEQLATSGVVVSLNVAMIPKTFHNASTQKLLEVKSHKMHRRHFDHVNVTEHKLNCEMNPQNSELAESAIERTLVCKLNVDYENNLFKCLAKELDAQVEEVQVLIVELNLSNACGYQDVISDVNKEKNLELVYRYVGDTLMLDASELSTFEQQSEDFDDDLDKFSSPVSSIPTLVSPLNIGSKKRIA